MLARTNIQYRLIMILRVFYERLKESHHDMEVTGLKKKFLYSGMMYGLEDDCRVQNKRGMSRLKSWSITYDILTSLH